MTRAEDGLKVILLGNTNVGKSTLMVRLLTGTFEAQEKPTLSGSWGALKLQRPDGETMLFKVWDTAGQERYRGITKIYYRDVAVAFLVYDVSDSSSFAGVEYFYDDLRNHTASEPVCFVIANKIDLESEADEDFTQRVESFVTEKGLLTFAVSAKEGTGIDGLLEALVENVRPPANREVTLVVESHGQGTQCCGK